MRDTAEKIKGNSGLRMEPQAILDGKRKCHGPADPRKMNHGLNCHFDKHLPYWRVESSPFVSE
jgi:hypothetical protein